MLKIPGLGRSHGLENGSISSPGEILDSPQYSCLGNPMDRGAWWATIHVASKSQTWLSMKRYATFKKQLWGKIKNDNARRKMKAKCQESSEEAEIIPIMLEGTRCFSWSTHNWVGPWRTCRISIVAESSWRNSRWKKYCHKRSKRPNKCLGEEHVVQLCMFSDGPSILRTKH